MTVIFIMSVLASSYNFRKAQIIIEIIIPSLAGRF